MGTQQSGMLELKVADIVKDAHVVVHAREAAKKILLKDPELSHELNSGIRNKLNELRSARPNWGEIA